MEDNERELIRTKLTMLIKHTRCTAEFLTFFFERKILTFGEIQEIAGIRVDSEKALKFYMLIKTRTRAFAVLKEGLKKYNQSGALNILERREDLIPEPTLEVVRSQISNLSFAGTTATSLSQRNICFDVVPSVVSFTGRTAELEQLHQMILRSQNAKRLSVVTQITSVSGLGGIGKTELAREYVRLKGKEFNGNVLWMNAESEESLYDSFKRLAKRKLNLPIKDGNGRDMPGNSIAEAVYNYFVGMKALFVLDNAEKVAWLKQFMPRTENKQNFFFLITSRDREWDRGVEILSLDGLSEDEAVDLIQKGLEIEANDLAQTESVRKLAQTLQYFPLALQQAIAYIYEQRRTRLGYSVNTYLEEFKTKQLELLSYREENAISVDVFTATTATTWSITFDKIRKEPKNGKLASLILNVVSFLGADNIRRELFYRLQQKHHWVTLKMWNIASCCGILTKRRHLLPTVCRSKEIDLVKQEQTNAAIMLLLKYSMLNAGDGQRNLSVHRLVQAVTRNQLAQDGMEEIYLETAIQLLEGSDKNVFPAENISHALIFWRHAFKSHQIIQSRAWQVNRILWKMGEAGYLDEGLRFGNEALEKFKEVLGEDHLDCLWIQRNIGLIIDEQGYVDKAISVFQDILAKAKSTYGEDSTISLLTKENLGNSLRRSGKKQEALKILSEVLKKRKTFYGVNHLSTLIIEENYAVALLDNGNLTEAEKLFQRIIKIWIERGVRNSTKVLNLQSNLSTIYSLKRENEKALEIRRNVYKKLSLIWTENLEMFAVVCSNLGFSLNKVGKHEEALKILEGNVEKIKERLGSQHVRTLDIQQQTGRSYRGLGNFSKALEIFQSVHQDFVSLFGEDSLSSLNASTDVAVALSLLGEHSQAIFTFQDILPKMEALLGSGNLKVFITKWKYARAIERSAENMDTALDLLKDVKLAMTSMEREVSLYVEDITKDIIRMKGKIKAQDSPSNCLIV